MAILSSSLLSILALATRTSALNLPSDREEGEKIGPGIKPINKC